MARRPTYQNNTPPRVTGATGTDGAPAYISWNMPSANFDGVQLEFAILDTPSARAEIVTRLVPVSGDGGQVFLRVAFDSSAFSTSNGRAVGANGSILFNGLSNAVTDVATAATWPLAQSGASPTYRNFQWQVGTVYRLELLRTSTPSNAGPNGKMWQFRIINTSTGTSTLVGTLPLSDFMVPTWTSFSSRANCEASALRFQVRALNCRRGTTTTSLTTSTVTYTPAASLGCDNTTFSLPSGWVQYSTAATRSTAHGATIRPAKYTPGWTGSATPPAPPPPPVDSPGKVDIRTDAVMAPPGVAITFDGGYSSDADGIASKLWTFDDGVTSTEWKVSKSWSTPGVKTATFTITDTGGRKTAASKQVTITNPPPVQEPYGVRTKGYPTSSNRASSCHLTFSSPPLATAAWVDFYCEPDQLGALHFWAMQCDFYTDAGQSRGGAHIGCQWHPSYTRTGSRAFNWGGYREDGTEVAGSAFLSGLSSQIGNPNTCGLMWTSKKWWRLYVWRAAGPDGGGNYTWRGELIDPATTGRVPIRDLYYPAPWVRLSSVWLENFSACDAPLRGVGIFKAPTVWTSNGQFIYTQGSASYQTYDAGGCTNVDVSRWAGGGVQFTPNTQRVTPPGSSIWIG